MAEFILEVLTEEMPFSAQKLARDFLPTWVQQALLKQRIEQVRVEVLTTPRRLVVCLQDLPAQQPDWVEEKKGPPIHASLTVLRAFLVAHGLDSVDQCAERSGFYIAQKRLVGQPIADLLMGMVPLMLKSIPWKKSMRWLPDSSLAWPRPIRALMAVLDGRVLPVQFGPFQAGGQSVGHRFLAPDAFEVTDVAQYKKELNTRHVMVAGRIEAIEVQIEQLAQEVGYQIVENRGLIEELAALVEWPTAVLGHIDPAFLSLPSEILTLTMRTHQRYVALATPDGALAPFFIYIVNGLFQDTMASGYERVLHARLRDAQFLWAQDQSVPLDVFLTKLEGIIFHPKLGTLAQKVERMRLLAAQLAPNWPQLETAVQVAKLDLATHMVGEFPELQGIVGHYLARGTNLGEEVGLAVREHYKPVGPTDSIPQTQLGQMLAVVDKLDTLIQFFSVGEVPTSSKDPYALRRMALGIIRIVDGANLPLVVAFESALHAFFVERLCVYMAERYAIARLIVQASVQDNWGRTIAQAKALDAFLKTPQGEQVVQMYKRVTHILAQAEGTFFLGEPQTALLEEGAEHSVWAALQHPMRMYGDLYTLCEPMTIFFDTIFVNHHQYATRQNRLRLLKQVQETVCRLLPHDVLSDDV